MLRHTRSTCYVPICAMCALKHLQALPCWVAAMMHDEDGAVQQAPCSNSSNGVSSPVKPPTFNEVGMPANVSQHHKRHSGARSQRPASEHTQLVQRAPNVNTPDHSAGPVDGRPGVRCIVVPCTDPADVSRLLSDFGSRVMFCNIQDVYRYLGSEYSTRLEREQGQGRTGGLGRGR